MTYLLNEPIGANKFEGDAALRIANCIAKQIEAPDYLWADKDGIRRYPISVIGLDGRWGAGKSNVVRMVKDKFVEREGQFHFFEYDFWGHRLDLSRKMFLEELIDNVSSGWLLQRIWKRKLYRLTGTVTERVHGEIPQVNWTALAYLFCFLSFPFWRFVARNFADGAYAQLFLSVPIIIGVLAFCLSLICGCFQKNGTLRSALTRSLWLFRGRRLDYVSVDFRHECEPSICEFTRFLGRVLRSFGKRKLIVVLDNLDRLLPEEVLKCMSAIHILFAEQREKRPSNLCVVVPYDSERVVSALRKAGCRNWDAADYFRRTFDVVYRITPPQPSEWEAFFSDRYDIISHDDSALVSAKSEVRDILDWTLSAEELTPRKVISILNEIAVTYSVMGNDVSIRDIALFVATGGKIRKDSAKAEKDSIISGDFIANAEYRESYAADRNRQIAIAALYYQVSSGIATRMILPQIVTAALATGNKADFSNFIRTPGFHMAFIEALADVKDVSKVPFALEGAPPECDGQKYWDEYYDTKRSAIVDWSTGGRLESFERLLLKNITKWREYAELLRNREIKNNPVGVVDWFRVASVAYGIEASLHEVGRSQEGNFPDERIGPRAFLEMLAAFKSQYPLCNRTCRIPDLDRECVSLLRPSEDVEQIKALRYLRKEDAICLVKTREALARISTVALHGVRLNTYASLMECLTDGLVEFTLDSSEVFTFAEWAVGEDEDAIARAIVFSLKFHGFIFNIPGVHRFLESPEQGLAIATESLMKIAGCYLDRESLRSRLNELGRSEAMFQMLVTAVAKGESE